MPAELPPFAVMLAGALVALLGGPRLRQVALLLAPLLSLWALLSWPGAGTPDTAFWRVQLGGVEWIPCRLDGLAAVFTGLFCVAAFLSGLYSLHVKDRVQAPAALCYVGAALGAVGSADLISLFVFVEVMAFASVFLIWARGTGRATRAGWRYLLWQLAAGLLLLAGALLRVHATGSAAMAPLTLDDPGAWLLLGAFGIKACFPFLHAWMTDCYPEATATGTVWLSAFTTKVGVFALARMFPGTEELIWVGTAMTCFPIFYAVIENDLRRVLAYSLVNQVGFMVCGIGLGSDLALAGAIAHACNDVVFKGLLFMTMGSVLQQTGRIGGNELGGLWRSMPKTTGFCLVGAASISAFPLFSGFVSKSLVMSAALQQGHHGVWVLLLFASAGVFHHAGIKIPFFAFFAHDSGLRPKEPPWNMLWAMGLASALCVSVGCAPALLYGLLPYSFEYQPYHATHVLAQIQLLFWSALAFAWLRRTGLYPPEIPSVNLDADWALRRAGPALGRRLAAAVAPVVDLVRLAAAKSGVRAWATLMRHHGPQGKLARNWPTESMMLWTAVLLGALLVLSYL
jgi:multicomponent Na+:H+ antiporter subunit D